MKKTYINPQTLVVRVNLKSSVLVVSTPNVGIDTSGVLYDASELDVKAANQTYNVWNDDWSDDE